MHTLDELFAAVHTYARMYRDAETPALRALYRRLVVDFAFVIARRMQ